MAEQEYACVRGAHAARIGGSNPPLPTSIKLSEILPTDFAARSAAESVGQKSESLIVVGDAGLATPSGGHP